MYLGIDTSNYRTSICLIDADGTVLLDRRWLVPVAPGAVGARQSEAVFFHLRMLGRAAAEIRAALSGRRLRAVAASARPRPVEGSYMPVFEVGRAFGRFLAAGAGVPFYETTHQEGHIAAFDRLEASGPFWALHLSGGTTELLDVAPVPGGYRIAVRGGTRDVTVGQLIDRIGVRLGCPFPAGPCLEALARQAEEAAARAIAVPVRSSDGAVHLSGSEAALLRAIDRGAPAAAVARATEAAVARAIEKIVLGGAKEVRPLVLVGGVVANAFIRRRVEERLGRRFPLRFAPPELAGDNGCGVAWIARARERLGHPSDEPPAEAPPAAEALGGRRNGKHEQTDGA
ncbi:O-sialoglycoprotein endopeptidase [Hydrogenibacillus sp. N12]|uniref:Kae1-like domain-containing protein n=1 Tax=Hydrogenibacillus sp. N12 TaxID=2866627 RepID=UPI001C7DBEB1|nr:O-sialoglycoprotein endopeptidase [Hydrogenibacillus sp. N12]QZA34339.1 O-sialoglycoprotein endopeptidase [Hydrogenibacillus sp. N12]